jgi:hypothetical protein
VLMPHGERVPEIVDGAVYAISAQGNAQLGFCFGHVNTLQARGPNVKTRPE